MPNGKIVELTNSSVGFVRWKKTEDSNLYPIGLKAPELLPTVGTNTNPTNQYAAGEYTYGISLYDKDTGEESPLATVNITTKDHDTEPGNEVAIFSNFPDTYLSQEEKAERPNLKWRIYRMPVNGSEFLLVNYDTEISAAFAHATTFIDEVEDQNLGPANDSFYDEPVLREDSLLSSIAFFNDHLFVGGTSPNGTGKILFSRQGKWWAFDPENELNIEGVGFGGFSKIGENLVVSGGSANYVLYGDNSENFVLSETDFTLEENTNISLNSQREVRSNVLFAANELKEVEMLERSSMTIANKYIAAFNGATTKVISNKIDNLTTLILDNGLGGKSAVINNRFYAIEYIDFDATIKAISEAGKRLEEITENDYILLILVYDAYSGNWFTSNDTEEFSYHTKQFSRPRTLSKIKRVWTRGCGEFTVEFYGDNKLITTRTWNFEKPTTKYWNVKNRQYTTYSFRFIGKPGAQIHDFGVKE